MSWRDYQSQDLSQLRNELELSMLEVLDKSGVIPACVAL